MKIIQIMTWVRQEDRRNFLYGVGDDGKVYVRCQDEKDPRRDRWYELKTLPPLTQPL